MFSRKFFIITMLPAAIIFLSLMVYPMCQVLYLSTTDYKLTGGDVKNFVGLNQYIKIFTDSRFLSAMGRTFYFAIVSVVLSVLIGFIIAYLIQVKGVRGAGFFRTVILVPMLLTPLVAGSVFRFMFDYDYGIINYIITCLGLGKVSFLSSPVWALNSAIIVDVWQWSPFAAIVFLAGLEGIPQEPLEAAAIDGAGWWTVLFKIKLPPLKSVTGIVVLIRFMDAFREFDKLYILTSGGPGTSSETASIYVWRQAFQYFDTAYGAAAGVVMLLVITLMCTLYSRITKTVEKGG